MIWRVLASRAIPIHCLLLFLKTKLHISSASTARVYRDTESEPPTFSRFMHKSVGKTAYSPAQTPTTTSGWHRKYGKFHATNCAPAGLFWWVRWSLPWQSWKQSPPRIDDRNPGSDNFPCQCMGYFFVSAGAAIWTCIPFHGLCLLPDKYSLSEKIHPVVRGCYISITSDTLPYPFSTTTRPEIR